MKKIICRIILAALAVLGSNPCLTNGEDAVTVLDTVIVTDSDTKRKLLETNSAGTGKPHSRFTGGMGGIYPQEGPLSGDGCVFPALKEKPSFLS